MRTQIHKPKSGVGLVLTDASGELHVCQSPDELWQTVHELMLNAEAEPDESPAPRKRRAREDEEEESSADEDMIAGLTSSIVGELFRKAQGASFRGRKGTG